MKKKSKALQIVAIICIATVACASFVWMGLASRFWEDPPAPHTEKEDA